MDSVVLSTPLPSPDPSRSRLCMICGVSGNEYHVYIVDVVIDESSLGDNHKFPPRVIRALPVANAPDIDLDLSAYLEMTPNIVLVDFPRIEACTLDSVLYFFPQYPSTDVFSLELPKIGTSLNQHRVVYGEDGGLLKKAPNLLAPKRFPIAIRYGTRVLVFSTQIPMGLSGVGDHHFEIYHPCSEPEPPLNLKELPDLVILRRSSYGGFELYNTETKSSSEPILSGSGRYEFNRLYIKSYSLVEHIFVVRSNFGMFCIDLENPKVRGWERYFLGGRMIGDSICSARQVYVTQNHEMAMDGLTVYKDLEDELYYDLPRSFIPIPFNKHTRYFSHVMMLDSFKYPRCTPCIIQTQCDSEAGCSYMIMDVVRIDLSKLRLEGEEWAEIIHSFKFRMKHKRSLVYGCYAMFPI